MSVDTLERTGGHLDHFLSEDKRWYVFGEGDQAERFLRVSTALGHIEKEALRRWATGLSATVALNELPKLIRATRTKVCGNTWKRCQHDYRIRCMDCPCETCTPCVHKWIANRHYAETARRSEEGIRVHDVAENWVLSHGLTVPDHQDDIAPYVKQWLQWVADYGLTAESWEMTEATVINREFGYAGTLDGILTILADATPKAAELVAMVLGLPRSQVAGRSITVIADAKSREKEEEKLYSEYALQQVGYRRAEVVRLRDGREFPMPATDGAIIVQVRPDGYLCRPVVTDDATFRAFINILEFSKWHMDFATASVSSRSFKVPKEPKPEPKPRAAKTTPPAPRKAAPKKRLTVDPDEMLPLPPRQPVVPRPGHSALLRSMTTPLVPHPNSRYFDDIPF